MLNKFEKKLPLAIAITKVQQGYSYQDAADYAKTKTNVDVPLTTIRHNVAKLPQCTWSFTKNFNQFSFKINVIASIFYELDLDWSETSIESYFRLMSSKPDRFSIEIDLGGFSRSFDYDTLYGSIDEAKSYVINDLKINNFSRSLSFEMPTLVSTSPAKRRAILFDFIRACIAESPTSMVIDSLRYIDDSDLPPDLVDVKQTLAAG